MFEWEWEWEWELALGDIGDWYLVLRWCAGDRLECDTCGLLEVLGLAGLEASMSQGLMFWNRIVASLNTIHTMASNVDPPITH